MAQARRQQGGAGHGGIRVALYHRVSTLEQSAAGARVELRRWAAANGARIVLQVEETGSGAANNRPGLLRILEAARKHKLDAVVVLALDRFGRSALDLLRNLDELDELGVRFVAVRQGLELRPGKDPISRLLRTLLAGVAEFERELIRDRTRAGLERARARGKTLGRPRSPLPDRDRVLELRARGMSWCTVALELHCTVWQARQACTEKHT